MINLVLVESIKSVVNFSSSHDLSFTRKLQVAEIPAGGKEVVDANTAPQTQSLILPPLQLSVGTEHAESLNTSNHFMPFTFANERGWTEVFGVFKKTTVKQLGETLKQSLERGITETASGSPRFVTPLPKLTKKQQHSPS